MWVGARRIRCWEVCIFRYCSKSGGSRCVDVLHIYNADRIYKRSRSSDGVGQFCVLFDACWDAWRLRPRKVEENCIWLNWKRGRFIFGKFNDRRQADCTREIIDILLSRCFSFLLAFLILRNYFEWFSVRIAVSFKLYKVLVKWEISRIWIKLIICHCNRCKLCFSEL